MPNWFSRETGVRLLPYPDGKSFAFTIIDDTDGTTLETARLVYDYLFALGLRTTKTVWVKQPATPPVRPADTGDTLQRGEYAEYVCLLRRRGFEIALHNVSSASSTRPEIAAGIERFRQIVGEHPRINVHHEKNLENLYFEFAGSGRHLPPRFRTTPFQRLHKLLTRDGAKAAPPGPGCSGEDRRSEYFWGDLCKANVKYVRSNVFFQDLNTLKCNPLAPYASAETPYVNYWFDSSNGQDAACFNSILSDRNIDRLRCERGCSILYTHFGQGFVTGSGSSAELNATTRQRLRAIAGHPDGWYAPAGDLLDRLLAFHRVTITAFACGLVLSNDNPFPIASVTLRAKPSATYCGPDGVLLSADRTGRIVVPVLAGGRATALLTPDARGRARRWHEEAGQAWLADIRDAAQGLRERWRQHA